MTETAMKEFGHTWIADRKREEEFHKELEQMQVVVEASTGGGYEWDVYYVYWHTGRKRFYVISGGGCSCNWISDGVDSLGDFQEFATRQDVVRDFKQDHGSEAFGWAQYEIDSVLNAVRDFKVI